MSPAEATARAEEVLDAIRGHRRGDFDKSPGRPEHVERITAALLGAVAEEREACAKIADEEANVYNGDSAALVAERIRARASS